MWSVVTFQFIKSVEEISIFLLIILSLGKELFSGCRISASDKALSLLKHILKWVHKCWAQHDKQIHQSYNY